MSGTADGCRPSGTARGRRRAGGKGKPRMGRQRAARGKGSRRTGLAAHGSHAAARAADGAASCPALTRRGGTGRKGERGRADGKPAAAGRAGACAARLNGCELGKRKAPHGAGLVRFTGRRGIMPAGAGAARQRGFDRLDRTNGKAWTTYQSKRQAGAIAPAATV